MDMRDAVENCNSSPLWANLHATSCFATPSLLRKVSHSRINRELAWKPVRITNAVWSFLAVRSLRLLCQACPYTLLCYSVWRMNSSLDMGHGRYLVYSSKSSILEERIIVLQVFVYKQMLSFFEECILVFQTPAQFPNNKDVSNPTLH